MAWFSELKAATVSHWCFPVLHTYKERGQEMVSWAKDFGIDYSFYSSNIEKAAISVSLVTEF